MGHGAQFLVLLGVLIRLATTIAAAIFGLPQHIARTVTSRISTLSIRGNQRWRAHVLKIYGTVHDRARAGSVHECPSIGLDPDPHVLPVD